MRNWMRISWKRSGITQKTIKENNFISIFSVILLKLFLDFIKKAKKIMIENTKKIKK